jgi:ribosome-associated protein
MNFSQNKALEKIDFDKEILDIISSQNGENIKFFENEINPDLGKFVIIASFVSKRQVLFAVQKMIRRAKELKIHSTYQTLKRSMDTEWVCVRFGETIVHLFQEEVRDYYQIDKFYFCSTNEIE